MTDTVLLTKAAFDSLTDEVVHLRAALRRVRKQVEGLEWFDRDDYTAEPLLSRSEVIAIFDREAK